MLAISSSIDTPSLRGIGISLNISLKACSNSVILSLPHFLRVVHRFPILHRPFLLDFPAQHLVHVAVLPRRVEGLEVLDGREEEFPFITLVPQGLPGSGWEQQLEFLDNMLDAVIAGYAVDEDRIYLTGFSMGGAGVWAWGAHAPDRFAALAPIAGYWPYAEPPSEDERVCALAQVPIWMFHSEADETVPVQSFYAMDEALTACGTENVTITLFPDLDHSRTALHIYQDLAMFRWLVSQSR